MTGGLLPYLEHAPEVASTAFVAPGAFLVGRVKVGHESSVWFNAVLRGDINSVTVGDFTNLQDGCLLHVGDDHPATVGSYCTVGHAARIHGCTVGDGCLIGIGATILNGAEVGEGAVVGAGALVPEGRKLKPATLYIGIPVKEVRELSPEEVLANRRMAEKYARVARNYREG